MNTIDPCARSESSDLLSLEQALSIISANVTPTSGNEMLTLSASMGRISANDVRCSFDIPPHRNSAMDGYALNSKHIENNDSRRMVVAGTSRAGAPFKGQLPCGCCVRIFTGAAVPDQADTVIMQENTKRIADSIEVIGPVEANSYIRHPGDDRRKGQLVLPAGKRISAADLGLLASTGSFNVAVKPRLRVVFFSTGDELRSIGQKLEFGQIYDSNRYLLRGLLEQFGVQILDMGVVRDCPATIKSTLSEASKISDVIITTGGASVGESDHMHRSLEELGKIHFWKIAIKPGKPLLFGEINASKIFGLPGNPVSVMVTYTKVVLPALRKMSGEKSPDPLRLKVRCGANLRKTAGREEFQRGELHLDENGVPMVMAPGNQGSHVLSSMSNANCFIILPTDSDGAKKGDLVDIEFIQPF